MFIHNVNTSYLSWLSVICSGLTSTMTTELN